MLKINNRRKKPSAHFLIITLSCVIAAALNQYLSISTVFKLMIPLFLDTIFTAAVTFSFGLIPGLVTAFLTWLFSFLGTLDISVLKTPLFILRTGELSPFLICSIAEVFLVWRLKPVTQLKLIRTNDDRILAENISVLARLMLLYISASVIISILGGLIDYIYYTLLPISKGHISAEDVYKADIQQNLFPVPVMNILSRLPINLVDRFFVIFGGYFISLIICKFIPLKNKFRL